MKVFLVGTSFIPAYGGPARSVPRLAESLVDAGATVGIWASDQSALGAPFLKPSSQVVQLGGSLSEAVGQLGTPDVIHDNGLWRPQNHQVAKLAKASGIPRVVSIRGMLEPWAWKHKWLKKRLAWYLYQHADLRSAASYHVTSELERKSVNVFKLPAPIVEYPNGVDLPRDLRESHVSVRGNEQSHKTALFVGRIYPVKGLPMLVEAWAKVRPEGWRMRIVGPDQAGHRREVEALVAKYELADVFEFTGAMEGEPKREAFLESDLFVLGSHAENFGVAAGEALAYRVPVLATQATPWRLLSEKNCGWWVPTSVDGIANGLQEATSQPTETLKAMGRRGREAMERDFSWDSVGNGMLEHYKSIV
jgi:glycosyltransferase involved in cell wall biosynthesis